MNFMLLSLQYKIIVEVTYMGLDIYIDKCRKPIMKEFNGKMYRDYEERIEVCYWRKFWDLLNEGIPFKYGEDEYGQDIRLNKEDVEKILDYVSHHRDYFDSFQTVPDVCELLDNWDELKEDGWVICFNSNW